MIDIGLMHYFLGLEVWQEDAHIFLGQGKYAGDRLRRFHMADCKLMATLMINNWKKLHVVDSKLVDPTLYNQLIGLLMYLVNTRPYICFAVNTLSQFMVEPMRVHCVVVKRVVVPTGYIGLWNGLYLGRWSQRGAVKLEYISTNEQVTNNITKSLPRSKHVYFKDKMGVMRNTFLGSLEGASNYIIWKARISCLLDEHNLKTYVDSVVVVPTDLDPLKKYKAKMAKAKRLILDRVRDHVVCHIVDKDTARQMWEALAMLYRSFEQRKMYLEQKMRST
eukprot:PITA_32495